MKFDQFILMAGQVPCFTTGFLAAGQNLQQLRLQLDRWCKAGKVIRLTRGVYTLAEPYRKCKAEPFYIANFLRRPSSYVSLQSALAWHSLIPEYVPETTSVTASRPSMLQTPLGRFSYRHISVGRYWGCETVSSPEGLPLRIAFPAKALLDLVHLTPGGAEMDFLRGLRLQNTERINLDRLREFASRLGGPKMELACANIERIVSEDEGVEL